MGGVVFAGRVNNRSGALRLRMAHAIALVPLVALTMRLAATPTANLSYLVLAGYALLGRTQAIQALALSWLFTMLSPGIGPETTAASIGRYAVLAAAAVSVFLRSDVPEGRLRIKRTVLATILLGGFFLGHALLFSPILDVSILKAMSWTVAMATSLAAWAGLSPDARERLTRQVFGGLVVLMLVSLPLLVLPLGYLRNGTGFQGILSHPQTFGPTMALLGAWGAGRMLALRRPSWTTIGLVAICLVLVILSEARTAGLALVLGVGAAVFIAPGLSGRRIRSLLPGLKSPRIHLVLAAALIGGLIAGPILAAQLSEYLAKGTTSTQSLLEAYDRSRGPLMDQMWANVQRHPLQGIGFGIPSDPATLVVKRDPILGLPTSASVEKGVMPLAVLEELGAIGALLVAGWIWFLLRRTARGGVTPLAVCFTLLLTNMGESTLFSPGGMGLLLLILLGWCAASHKMSKTRP